ncbi:GNAT family N-acetyltransferase [Streptomyces sp. HUAS MG47]|uniref:GNAT family N-acetyltransferase n=1 Tax=Streptomyces solicamelliae TaxID=3231716 RepID=UPI003877BA78
MPPTDTGAPPSPPSHAGEDDTTLELRLPADFLALLADAGHGLPEADAEHSPPETDAEHGPPETHTEHGPPEIEHGPPDADDLLDSVAAWGPAQTPAGSFRLVPVRLDRDLRTVAGWMNDPAVDAFWALAGPESVTADHLRAQLDGDGRSVPCLGVLDGRPMSYFEIYRADLDPLARHYPARPHDTGVHLLIGGATDRGRGLGTVLLRAVADLVLDHRPRCGRVVAEPDIRNKPSVSAFLSAGFRLAGELELPDKRAALLVRDRTPRHVL